MIRLFCIVDIHGEPPAVDREMFKAAMKTIGFSTYGIDHWGKCYDLPPSVFWTALERPILIVEEEVKTALSTLPGEHGFLVLETIGWTGALDRAK